MVDRPVPLDGGRRRDKVLLHRAARPAPRASVEVVEHAAEEGNLVDTSLDSYPSDSDPEEEDNYLLKNQPLPVMIKSKEEDSTKEWPFPGFSRQLLVFHRVLRGYTMRLTKE